MHKKLFGIFFLFLTSTHAHCHVFKFHCFCHHADISVLKIFQVDPLVSLMMVEKVPDSTYEMIGGLDKQVREIKEVLVQLLAPFLV